MDAWVLILSLIWGACGFMTGALAALARFVWTRASG